MKYNPYKYLNETEYNNIKIEFAEIVPLLTEFMINSGFKESDSKPGNADYFAIGFNKPNDSFTGGIGVSYDDLPENETFSLHLIKCLDKNNGRYFKKIVFKSLTLEELKTEYRKLLEIAINSYNNINESDLDQFFELTTDD